MNDMVAASYGVRGLEAKEFTQIKGSQGGLDLSEDFKCLLVGIGTGFGCTFLRQQ